MKFGKTASHLVANLARFVLQGGYAPETSPIVSFNCVTPSCIGTRKLAKSQGGRVANFSLAPVHRGSTYQPVYRIPGIKYLSLDTIL